MRFLVLERMQNAQIVCLDLNLNDLTLSLVFVFFKQYIYICMYVCMYILYTYIIYIYILCCHLLTKECRYIQKIDKYWCRIRKTAQKCKVNCTSHIVKELNVGKHYSLFKFCLLEFLKCAVPFICTSFFVTYDLCMFLTCLRVWDSPK